MQLKAILTKLVSGYIPKWKCAFNYHRTYYWSFLCFEGIFGFTLYHFLILWRESVNSRSNCVCYVITHLLSCNFWSWILTWMQVVSNLKNLSSKTASHLCSCTICSLVILFYKHVWNILGSDQYSGIQLGKLSILVYYFVSVLSVFQSIKQRIIVD